jgi:hypothetical protein
MEGEPWRGEAGELAAAGLSREDLCLAAAEVIESQRGVPTPIDPVR